MKSVLITGATGFIGARLAEHLSADGTVECAGLVRDWSRAARLSRLVVEMIAGDVMDLPMLEQAARGRDTIFHCAVDWRIGGRAQRRAIAKGTENVLHAALTNGVGRVVHLSSVAVYSYAPRPDAATETGRYRYSGDPYCDGKIDAEKIALRYHQERGVPVVILRPTIVYGPHGGWSAGSARQIRAGAMSLVDGGRHICNTLYVDNLVEAMRLAAEREEAVGQVFHVSDAEPVTWKAFVEAHALALGPEFLSLPSLMRDEIEGARRRQRPRSSLQMLLAMARRPEVRLALATVPAVRRCWSAFKAVARPLPEPVLRSLGVSPSRVDQQSTSGDSGKRPWVPSPAEVAVYSTSVIFSIEKARRVLGYQPTVDFQEGMARTSAWLRWSGVA